MRAITLAYYADGKSSLLHGPEVNPSIQRATRLAARSGKVAANITRLETYSISVENRLGVTAVATAQAEKPVAEKKPKIKAAE